MSDAHRRAPGLCEADFVRIAENGFGDAQNSYAHSIAYFRDHVYVGTLRNALPLLKLFPPADPPVLEPWPVRPVGRVEELNLLAQIWRYDPAGGSWAPIHTSPEIPGRNGGTAPRDIGYRGMAVFQGRSDPEPVLYASTISTVLRGTPALILRSVDGERFDVVSEPGLGNPNTSTFRSLITFDGHLWAAPAGEGTTWNTTRSGVVVRSADPAAGKWEVACRPGFGDPLNHGIFELAPFNGHLYAGTFNYYEGFQIWKTPATGDGPCRWTKVVDRGANRGPLNEMPLGMCAFGDALYVGTGIQNGGYDRNNRVGPAAGELIRIHPDDSWELVVGSPRRTPEGMKYPLSGMGPGFDNFYAGYIWRMVTHDGWLYASTFDWSMFLPYAPRPPLEARRMLRRFGLDQLLRLGAGFQLWRTRDGRDWVPVTRTGMGNPYNHGGRALLSTPHGLFVGTANPFGPEVATRLSSGWIYVPNPAGGAEVYLGRPRPERPRAEPPVVVRPSRGRRRKEAPPRRRVLLTGATGLVGARVLDGLLGDEAQVRAYVLPGTAAQLPQGAPLEVVEGDLARGGSLREAVEGVDTVYHLAALLPGSPHAELMRVNVEGTRRLLEACAAAGVRRFVFASSVAVYEGAFRPAVWPLTEHASLRPRGSPGLRSYGASKLAAEEMVREHAERHGFEYVILRPSTVYGPGSRPVESLVRRVLTDRWSGRGRLARQTVQLLHVRDLAEVVVRAGTHPAAANEAFNVSGVESRTYGNLAWLVRGLARVGGDRALLPDHDRRWQRYLVAYDIEKAAKRLEFRPRVTLQEGFAELVEVLLARGEAGHSTLRRGG